MLCVVVQKKKIYKKIVLRAAAVLFELNIMKCWKYEFRFISRCGMPQLFDDELFENNGLVCVGNFAFHIASILAISFLLLIHGIRTNCYIYVC